jgi:uncharacterized Zn finger protein (UPF0148 family)
MTWHCPGCGTRLTDEAAAMWCAACERTVSYAELTDEAERSAASP